MMRYDIQEHASCFGLNPLNAELNPICHLLVLLGDLTFMGPCIVIIFQYTHISWRWHIKWWVKFEWKGSCNCKHYLDYITVIYDGTWQRSWLKHCATSQKVAGSILDGVIGIFHWHNPSGRTMALGSTQPLTEMSTRNISLGVKGAGEYGWQPYHLHMPIVLKSGSLNLLEPSGPVQAWTGIALPFTVTNALFN
jgi:hypothetical protein